MPLQRVFGITTDGVGDGPDGLARRELETDVRFDASAIPIVGRLIDGVDTEFDPVVQRELSRDEWLLALLYASDGEKGQAAVPGDLTLNLTLFVLAKNFEEYLDYSVGLDFDGSNIGPKAKIVEEDMRQLLSDDIVRSESIRDPEHELDQYRYFVGDEGRDRARNAWESLGDEARDEIERIKSRLSSGDLGDLITYAYRKDSEPFEGELVRR